MNFWNKIFHRKRNYICIEAANYLIHLIGNGKETVIQVPPDPICDAYVDLKWQDGVLHVGIIGIGSTISIATIDNYLSKTEHDICKWSIKRTLELLREAGTYRTYNKRILLLHPDANVCNIIQRIIDHAKDCPWLRRDRITILCGICARMEDDKILVVCRPGNGSILPWGW